MKTIAFLMTIFVSAVASAQQTSTTGYAPVNGLKMYYEVRGSGEPVVLLHGAFMTITNNWTGWIGELSKTRKVIAVEMQGHGRTADIEREFSHTTHVTLIERTPVIVPMVNDFFDAKPQKQ
jgi:pimeloyl-ACP methyl ester carboxylesterase